MVLVSLSTAVTIMLTGLTRKRKKRAGMTAINGNFIFPTVSSALGPRICQLDDKISLEKAGILLCCRFPFEHERRNRKGMRYWNGW